MIRVLTLGSTKRTEAWLRKLGQGDIYGDLHRFGQMGVNALAASTPIDSGKTASSWGYEIHRTRGAITIVWTNSNVNDGARIAILLQYGHGTGTGGYVQGRDYINPATRPVFDMIAEQVWRRVTSG